jgi:N-acetyl-anhydromuramyl-L-alanine amidase AmpD
VSEQPDYPGAIWIPAAPTAYRKAGRLGYAMIIIHATDGRADPRATAEMFATLGHKTSAHFIVGLDGTIVQCVRLTDVAYHAHQINSLSVGIEHCCRTPGELGPNDPGLPPTAEQLYASAKLTKWLCEQRAMGLTRANIKGHAEADPDTTHADCPEGAGINLDAYVGLVNAV